MSKTIILYLRDATWEYDFINKDILAEVKNLNIEKYGATDQYGNAKSTNITNNRNYEFILQNLKKNRYE